MPSSSSRLSEPDSKFWRCTRCGGSLRRSGADSLTCDTCGAAYPIRDDVLIVQPELGENNAVARDFYDSPLWPRFRFWEWFTFVLNGGERRSRDKILRHLSTTPGLSLLDVAIGDGVYLEWLPPDWSVVGIDISQGQLAACQTRNAKKSRDLTLILGEAEELPFQDHQFDAVLSIGGFNYFNDPEKALREMVRVVKPGATIVVADEVPDLTNRMLFHKLGMPAVDRFIVSRMLHLGDPFTEMVERYRDLDVAAIGKKILDDCRYELIWRKFGYVLVGKAPMGSTLSPEILAPAPSTHS